MSAQRNQQLTRYVLSKAIECLEQNVRKLIITKDYPIQMKECKIFELRYGNKSCRMFENITR